MGIIKYGVGWVKADICGAKEDKETVLTYIRFLRLFSFV